MSMNDQEHPDDLLPWYVNGTLEGEERDRVESHVAGCEVCQQEVAFLKNLHAGMRAEEPEGVGELGLRRLLRQVREEKRGAGRPRWLVPTAAVAAIFMAVQVVILTQFPTQTADSGGYAPLSSDQASGPLIQIEFQPDASAAAINTLLRDAGLRLVDGPSAIGLYRASPTSDVDINLALEVLRAAKGVVRYASIE
jgi:hypothetical protein